jgi:hypothetical protein
MSKAAGGSPQVRLDTLVIDSHPILSFDRNSQAKSSSIRYALAYGRHTRQIRPTRQPEQKHFH